MLRADGSVVAWGASTVGQLNVPFQPGKLVAISATVKHTLALREDGSTITWGSPMYAPLAFFIPNSAKSNMVSVVASWTHSLALKADRTPVAWGGSTYGQTTIPVGLSNITTIVSADTFNVALAPNVQPQATNFAVTTSLNTDVVIKLPIWDPNGDNLTVRIPTLPTAGSLYQCVAGTRGALINTPNTLVTDPLQRIIFVPASGETGAPYNSFGYVGNDGELDSVTAAVTVNVHPPFSLTVSSAGGGAVTNSFPLSFNGFSNLTYRVWASTNLTSWSVLGSATQVNVGVFQFDDFGRTNFSKRFYRVTTP